MDARLRGKERFLPQLDGAEEWPPFAAFLRDDGAPRRLQRSRPTKLASWPRLQPAVSPSCRPPTPIA